MQCFYCRHNDTKVTDSRLTATGAIRRRRECLQCGYRFSTLEEIEILDLVVLKRDGEREAYERAKLKRGLRRALEKRPITKEDLKNLVSKIEIDLQKLKQREIKSSQIGEIIMTHLKNTDKVAYIRFASVYKSFEDADHFWEEIQKLA